MYKLATVLYFCLIGFNLGYSSPLVYQPEDDPCFQQALALKGNTHVVDHALTVDDVIESARFNPTQSNVYHLFTRDNPTVSQPIVLNYPEQLRLTNYKNSRRTIVLIHDRFDSAAADSNTVLIPAILEAEDVNIIVVDWSAGASSSNYRIVIMNTVASGRAVAQFIDWLNQETGSTAIQYHIIGHGFGGHQAGIVGRHVYGDVAYVTDPPVLIFWKRIMLLHSPKDEDI